MELYLDLGKSIMNTGRLVRRLVQVHGKNGKTFSRMQWVDPDTNQPVHEHSLGEDHHTKRIHSLSPEHKEKIARAYKGENYERAEKFAHHTGIDPEAGKTQSGLNHHIIQHLDKVPHEQIKHLLDHYAPETDKLTAPAPLGLEHTEHHLSDEELEHRTGKNGPLDLSTFTKGVRFIDNTSVKRWTSDSQNGLNSHKLSQGKNIDAKEHLANAFGSMTVAGLEHAFSVPELGYKSRLDYVRTYMEKDGHVWNEISFSMDDEDDYNIASMTRLVRRDENGMLHVNNHILEVKGRGQGDGLATHLYARSEQLWRHMSGGHPVHITVTANISVGTYAWAKKGFDFARDDGLDEAIADMEEFCDRNGVKVKDVLKHSGLESTDDLRHPWDFAVLDDGYEWDMKDVKGLNVEDYASEWNSSKTVSFGKAFMLGGMNTWKGIRRLNENSLEERVYDPLKKYKKWEPDEEEF